MRETQTRLDMALREEQRQVDEFKARASAEERAAAAAEIERAVKMGLSIPDAATWDQVMGQQAPDLVGQFGNRQAIAMSYMSMADALKAVEPGDPTEGAPQGYMWTDPNNRGAGVTPLAGYEAKPQSGLGKFYADQSAGFVPPDAKPPQEGTVVNVSPGGNTSDFIKEADKKAAERLNAIVAAGQNAQEIVGDLTALANLAAGIGTGKEAQITAALGPYAEAIGVDIAGLGEMQAFSAIRDKMAPLLRQPGSGTTSDFDARQFLSALPGLGRTPEGNKIIVDTLQAVLEHRLKAAEISNLAFSGEITWQDADRQISALGNPFDAFNKSKTAVNGRPDAQAPSPGDVMDGYRFKGGNPADRNSWERVE